MVAINAQVLWEVPAKKKILETFCTFLAHTKRNVKRIMKPVYMNVDVPKDTLNQTKELAQLNTDKDVKYPQAQILVMLLLIWYAKMENVYARGYKFTIALLPNAKVW